MKILVTGGAGFIGSHIVDAYIKEKHSVAVIDNLSTGQKKYIHPKVHFYHVDIRDTAEINTIFAKEKPVVLNHHAAQMNVRKSVADPKFDADVNILGFLNLLEAGRKNDLEQVIFASSGGAVYGDAQITPTPETYTTKPLSPYGISKLCSEYYLQYYKYVYDINFVALRYGNVYGPRQNPHGEAGVIAIFTQKLLENSQPVINGNGKQTRDFVYVGDVVAANVLALANKHSFIVNIGTAEGTDINQIFTELTKLTHKSFKQIHGPAKLGEQQISVLDASLARTQLNWQARVPLAKGLKETVNFFTYETE